MALNIKNDEVEALVADVARLTGESKTEAVRKALIERRARLSYEIDHRDPETRLRRFLEREVWPTVPSERRGRRLSAAEEDEILGYGPLGA
jgi:antitoxin VapB